MAGSVETHRSLDIFGREALQVQPLGTMCYAKSACSHRILTEENAAGKHNREPVWQRAICIILNENDGDHYQEAL